MKKTIFLIFGLIISAFFFVATGASATTDSISSVDNGTLSFDQDSFYFGFSPGDTKTASQYSTFVNTSDLIVYYTISVPNQPSWLNTGYNTSQLASYPGTRTGFGASVNPTGLTAGTYSTDIIMTGNFIGSPKTIPISVTVGTNLSPSINVSFPNGGESWAIGVSHEISWISSGSIPYVSILLINSANVSSPIIENTTNTGLYSWVPSASLNPGQYKIYISGSNYQASDISNNYFNLVSLQNGSSLSAPALVSPANGMSIPNDYPLQWSSVISAKQYEHKIYDSSGTNELYSFHGDASFPSVQTSAINYLSYGTYKWKVRACANLVSASPASDSTCGPWSNLWSFTIISGTSQPSFFVTTPNGGERWITGSSYVITWYPLRISIYGAVDISLIYPDSTLAKTIATGITNATTYKWTIPSDIPDGLYKIKISNFSGVFDTSDSVFTISRSAQSCSSFWWFDNTSRICQQKSFCGTYMYSGLQTFTTQQACQTALASGQSACTMDTKLCPDGSYVFRVPPSCEFATCSALSLPYPNGTIVKTATYDKIYLIENNQKRWITSVEAFIAYGLIPNSQIIISQADLDKYPNGPDITTNSPNLSDGALIRAIGDVDVYIIKYVGTKKFKRLILSPAVFNSYGHLSWSNIQAVDQTVVNTFATSNLVRAVNDPRVYKLIPSGDTGQRQWVETIDAFNRMGFDWDAIYQINQVDRDSYVVGQTIQ